MYKLKTNPWGHQWKALDYVMTHDHAAIFTDMGSGKTKIMIDMIVNRKLSLVLIVGTLLSCPVWEKEIYKHSNIPEENVFNLTRMTKTKIISALDKKQLRAKISDEERDFPIVFIINYESVWRDRYKKAFNKLPIECIICDESHKIKSPSNKTGMYLYILGKKVPYRYILTGTPCPEAPTDIYGQYRFLDPTIFGTNFGDFREQYEHIDIELTAKNGYRVLDKKQPYVNLDILKNKMYSCAFYAESEVELPEVTHVYIKEPLSKKGQSIYKELSKEGVYEDAEGILETNNSLSKYTRLQQVLSGYLTLENRDFTSTELVKRDNSKVLVLKELLESIPKTEKIVVFAKFHKDFEEIFNLSKKLSLRYGEVSGVKNNYLDWMENKIDVLAVQYNSGAESIDLTASRYCIYYSHTFSYGKYQQSLKRTHRPGQTRPVTYYHIISTVKGTETVDQKIKKALSMKKSLSEYLLEKGELGV